MDEEVSVLMTVRFEGPEYALDYLREAIDQIPEGNAWVLTTVDA